MNAWRSSLMSWTKISPHDQQSLEVETFKSQSEN
jgi:hypothetical protein